MNVTMTPEINNLEGINPADYKAMGDSMMSLAKTFGAIALAGAAILVVILIIYNIKAKKQAASQPTIDLTAFASNCWAKMYEDIDEDGETYRYVSVFDNDGQELCTVCENDEQLLAGVYSDNNMIYLVAYEEEGYEEVVAFKWVYNTQTQTFDEC